jgi:hypothetical protein
MSNFDWVIREMTDEQLIQERNHWNALLERTFHQSSAAYDTGATIVKRDRTGDDPSRTRRPAVAI